MISISTFQSRSLISVHASDSSRTIPEIHLSFLLRLISGRVISAPCLMGESLFRELGVAAIDTPVASVVALAAAALAAVAAALTRPLPLPPGPVHARGGVSCH